MLVKEGIFADQAIVKIQNSCIHIVCFCKRVNSLTSVSLKVKYDDGFCFFLGCTHDMKVRRPGIKHMPQHWPWSLRWLVGSLTYCATRKLIVELLFAKLCLKGIEVMLWQKRSKMKVCRRGTRWIWIWHPKKCLGVGHKRKSFGSLDPVPGPSLSGPSCSM